MREVKIGEVLPHVEAEAAAQKTGDHVSLPWLQRLSSEAAVIAAGIGALP